jgi:hypothetical protein
VAGQILPLLKKVPHKKSSKSKEKLVHGDTGLGK